LEGVSALHSTLLTTTVRLSMANEEDQKDLKTELCVGRCKYMFYPTEVEQSIDEENKTQTEKTKQGILCCESCGHTQDLEFE